MKANFTQQWLTILAGMTPETRAAVFYVQDRESQTLQMLATWPEDLADASDFAQIVEYALLQKQPVSILNVEQSDNQLCDYLAQPVFIQSELLGVVIVKVSASPKEKHGTIFTALQHGAKWLALAENKPGQTPGFYSSLINMLSSCIEQNSYREQLITLVTKFTQSLQCEQVAIGEFDGQHSKVVALSNSAQFDDRTNFIQKIADAMDEAIEQDSLIEYPNSGATIIQRAHHELARKFGSGSALTIPLIAGQKIYGAITLLRREDRPFDDESVRLCRMSMALITPFLELQRRDGQSILLKITHSIQDNLTGLLGLKHLQLKLTTALICGLLLAATLLKGDFNITADAVLEGKMQRVIAAPIEGFLLSEAVRAGDIVHGGELMATLDGSELQLELSKLNGQLQKFRREYREALSTNDLVKVRVISAQIDQADAEMELARQQLQKIALTAPYDSVVIEGDLSQRLGSPVERGDVLFKIAPLQGYRIILKVDERLISYVRAGQKGVLALSGLPEQKLELTVDKITAVAKAENNSNIFRVEASLHDAPDILRPGMEGIGKINAGKERLLWIWTHDISNWLRLWLWSWW